MADEAASPDTQLLHQARNALMKRQKTAHQEVQQLASFRQDLEVPLGPSDVRRAGGRYVTL